MRQEVEARKAREEQEHKNYVIEAKEKQFKENCEEAREEVRNPLKIQTYANKSIKSDLNFTGKLSIK